jgi:hypothetical protein
MHNAIRKARIRIAATLIRMLNPHNTLMLSAIKGFLSRNVDLGLVKKP